MPDRSRIQGSSRNRHQEPTNEHNAPTDRERQKRSIPPNRLERSNMAGKASRNVDPEDNYGSGKRPKRRPVEQQRYSPSLGGQERAGDDLTRHSGGNGLDDYEEPPFHNNYDDYDRVDTPSKRW
jgi:hypothetical protein